MRTPGSHVAARALSGGNLQKFVIGREILQKPEVLVVNQPTWGVDAAAAAAIRQALLDLAAGGAAVIVVSQDLDEIIEVRCMIERHVQYTGSELGKRVLANWNLNVPKFVKIAPRDYTRMVNAIKRVTDSGLSGEEAVMVAFEENARDLSRVGGN